MVFRSVLKTYIPLVVPVFLFAATYAGNSVAQERGKIGYTNQEILALCDRGSERGSNIVTSGKFFSAESIAYSIHHSSGLWVDGEFSDIPTESPEEILAEASKLVSLKFNVSQAFNGYSPATIHIELESDMLVFPGERVSRYEKRQSLSHVQWAEIETDWNRLDEINKQFEGDSANNEGLEGERRELLEALTKTWSESIELAPAPVVVPTHGESFYDYGGAVTEDEKYLMRLQPIRDRQGAYQLREVYGGPGGTIIFWGERRKDILRELKSPGTTSMPTPFGAFDPNKDEDCRILRGNVQSPAMEGPSQAAAQLLEQHKLVAYGEFIGIPEATGRERSSLRVEEVELEFRVIELYQGNPVELIRVALNSDMLPVPGENKSRYSKRQEILAEQEEQLSPYRERYRDVRDSVLEGKIDASVLHKETSRLRELEKQIWENSALKSRRSVYSLVGDTFYDRGGVLLPYQGYLVGLNSMSNDGREVYLLEDMPDSPSLIFWGEEAVELMRHLEIPARSDHRREREGEVSGRKSRTVHTGMKRAQH